MPKKDKDVVAPEIIADDLSIEEIADHLAKTLVHTASTEALWPGLISLPARDRTGNLGKLVAQLRAPLQHLFTALTPKAGENQQTQQKKADLAKVFNSLLGGQDRGKDDSRFEAELLIQRMARIEAQRTRAARVSKRTQHKRTQLPPTIRLPAIPG